MLHAQLAQRQVPSENRAFSQLPVSNRRHRLSTATVVLAIDGSSIGILAFVIVLITPLTEMSLSRLFRRERAGAKEWDVIQLG